MIKNILKLCLLLTAILLSINGTIGNISFYNNENIVLGKSACYINVDDKLLDKYFYEYGGDEKELNNEKPFGMNHFVEEKPKEPKQVSEMMTYVEFKYFLSDNGFIELN